MDFKNLFLRRKILINAKLQYLVVGFFVGLSILNLLFFLLALKFLNEGVIMNVQSLDEKSRAFFEQTFSLQYSSILQAVLGFSIFSLIFSVVAGLVLLHHVAGPAYAIKKYLDELVIGNTSRHPLKLRKNDFLEDIASSINLLVEQKCPELPKKKE